MISVSEHVVASADELSTPGDRVLATIGSRQVGVFNVDGDYYAYPNWCPHQDGPLCAGTIDGTVDAVYDREALEETETWVKEGQILRCPWHSWEFDMVENRFLHDPDITLPSYPVRIEDGDVIVTL